MIYCVEDDENIRELVIYTLQSTGMQAMGFNDGQQFFQGLEEELPELILLDIMLPGESGIEILGKLKAKHCTKNIPVIMLTAKGSEYDKVVGLDSGADDYITKPFGMMELVSRIKAVLRRSGSIEKHNPLHCANVCMDIKKHEVTVDEIPVVLTRKEFELLHLLLQNKNNVLTREQLLTQVWGYEYCGETRTVDVHIRTLRQKLSVNDDFIETVRGVGYRVVGD